MINNNLKCLSLVSVPDCLLIKASNILQQLSPDLSQSVIVGESPGNGVAMTWTNWPRSFHLEIENEYEDAYILENNNISHIDDELSIENIQKYISWVFKVATDE